ncbi:MAG: ChaN family lipoprotein [Bacteroidales bacterium]
MKHLLALVFTGLSFIALAQDKPAYRLLHGDGSPATWNELTQKAASSQVILFGELHNNPICHWLQYELTADLFKKLGKQLVLGAEMFETDNQLLLDEYINQQISVKNFEAEAKLWPNYKTDYKPLVDFARENQLSFKGTNIPRRYAALVNKGGFEALGQLTPEALRLMAPLPMPYDSTLPGYRAMLNMGGHASVNLPKAQAAKDATMAWFILKNLHPGQVFLHFNGSYHSDNYEGIVWYLKKYRPEIKILTISSIETEDLDKPDEETKGKADFILMIPGSMTKTH